MKKIISILLLSITTILLTGAYAQLSRSIHVSSPGTLAGLLGNDKTTITNLTLTGNMNDQDFATIREMAVLEDLDMRSVNLNEGKIPNRAFRGKIIKKILLPVSLKNIEGFAFESFESEKLDFTRCINLEEIKEEAFLNIKLTGTNILDFSQCPKLWPENCGAVNPFVFFTGEVRLPSAMKRIPSNFFERFKGTVTFPSGIEIIGSRAFAGANLSDDLLLPVSLKIIESGVFWEATLNQRLTLPALLQEIGGFAFAYTNIQGLDFSNCQNLSNIGEEAFLNIKLTETNILDFSQCPKLWPENCGAVNPFVFFTGEVRLPSIMKRIPNSMFERFKGTVIFPSGIETIGSRAFAGANLSEALLLPVSLKILESGVFWDATLNQKLIFPPTLQDIGSVAFAYMKVQELDFSNCQNLDNIGGEAFLNIKLTETNMLNFSQCPKLWPENCGAVNPFIFFTGEVRLPSIMKRIPNSMFERFKGSVVFPSGLETIGHSAFYNAQLSRGLVLPNTLKVIEDNAFLNSTIPSLRFEEAESNATGVSCF